ncbi:hypothetical protein H6F46_07685 [Limnothrix sp. FACHB-1083]|nr:hypothetical protein [Limnothrix sp. FACHB-1088]MBD2160572.1 hypothetical protein [Limnothrix sp. FACHB-1083]MBD2191274.1 hypothetical protein [Limnothrix sp. FACHB-1088]
MSSGVSLWDWELSEFGIPLSTFRPHDDVSNKGHLEVLDDANIKKLEFAYAGLQTPSVRNLFLIPDLVKAKCRELLGDKPYACIHIRRGDYLRVADYLVSDRSFSLIIQGLSRVIPHIVIVTDSPLSQEFQNFQERKVADVNITPIVGGNSFLSHAIMRMSSILVCSNSQYSYTAACLMETGSLSLFPKQYLGESRSSEELHDFFAGQSDFMVINNKSSREISRDEVIIF